MALIITSPPPTPSSSSSSSLFSPSPPNPRRPFPAILCHSTTSTNSPRKSKLDGDPPPSLSDQLLPLSQTLLSQQPKPPHLPANPPTWLNPSKPKPTVLSPHRHRRPSFSLHPDLRPLTLLSRSLPDDPPLLSAALAAHFPSPPPHSTSLLLLNSLRPWHKSYHFFTFLRSLHSPSPLPTIFYNLALKSLRLGRRFDLAEPLAQEMLDSGIQMDNVTFSTVITAARNARRFDRALHWFETMYRNSVIPDEVTYSAVLDVFAKLGRKEEVIGLYERARAGGWKPDNVAFSVLAKMFGRAGDYDGIQYVLKEMRTLEVRPNVVVYNTLLEAMGKAGKPGLARSLFEEMLESGLKPNEKTLTALIKIYGKARWGRDALQLWERMRANKWPVDFILYNTLLSMCADLGLEAEAEKLFEEMKGSENRGVRPDSWSYTAMINIYGSGGKVERAVEVFEEMLERGVKPNVMGCTCLVQCLGKAGRIEDAVRVFETSMERGVVPDDRLCGCLLSVVALCEEGEMGMVLGCLQKANAKLVRFVKTLGEEGAGFDGVKEEFRTILNEATVEVRRPFCNCLIDICRNRGFPSQRAHELLYLGNLYGLYPGLYTKSSGEWSLNLRSLSVGAANTAFEEWMDSISESVKQEEVLPEVFSVQTGAGTHKFSQGLPLAFAAHLRKLDAPFRQDELRSGSFVARREDLISWTQSRVASPVVTA